jgi:phenylpropionate dioxygenase-like ring-hydroxylating dioxygenase large terminal subunit
VINLANERSMTGTDTHIFNNAEKIIEGWYWAIPSRWLRHKRARAFNFFGRELVLYRSEAGRVHALDAYCPHMGAHLAEGKVEGEAIRCLFHYWKFNSQGRCTEIPCQDNCSFVPPIQTWQVEETYGLIWIWAGQETAQGLPFVPELENQSCDYLLANRFVKACHPNVMMINAIDAQHFNSVHHLPVELHLEPARLSPGCIQFTNTTAIPRTRWWTRLLARFYRKRLTYDLCYFFGSTGTVTLGPDFLHFHIMFALRPTKDGGSEGQTILLTKKRDGFFGKLLSFVLLMLTRVVGAYFAKGDTLIFKTIQFNLRTPIKADAAIIQFIQHAEKQRAMDWGLPLATRSTAEPHRLKILPGVRAQNYLEREAK